MSSRFLLFPLVVAASGCIKPPEVVLVDRATALEQQAAGSFDELETKLLRIAATPKPTSLSPEQLQTLGIRSAPINNDAELSDADRVDDLLKQRCIGESMDGLLVDTPGDCQGAADHDLIVTLLERTNNARQQLWKWMHDRRPTLTVEELRRAWHDAHLHGMVCDGWFQTNEGKWSAKAC